MRLARRLITASSVTPDSVEASIVTRLANRLTPRAAGRLAWSLWGVCVGLTAIALLFGLLGNDDGDIAFDLSDAVFVVGFLVFPTVGALVATRHPSNPIGWLFLAVGLLWIGLNHFGHFYAQYALIARPDTLPGGVLVAWLTTWGWLPSLGLLLTFMLLLFPDGQLPDGRWKLAAWLAGMSIVVGSVSIALDPGPLGSEGEFTTVTNPIGIERYETLLDIAAQGSILLMLLCGLASVASLVVRFRHADRVQRQQIKWVVFAASLVVVGIIADSIARQRSSGHESGMVGEVVKLTIFAVPIAAGIAILRYRLWDIDLLINRTLVYGALTIGVIGVYILVVAYLGQLFHAEDNLATSLVATGIVAVLFQPLRDLLQRGVNRLMYGDRDDPYGVIARLGRRLEATLTPDAVLPAIVETIAQALKLPYAAIALKQGDDFALAAVAGTPNGMPLRLPLVYQSELVGQLELSPRAPGETFSVADRQLLEGIAHQAGIAAHAVRLTADLQRSRERLVMAREEERRRIRRDLHDGLGPALAGLTLHIDAARNSLRPDPETADALLGDLKTQIQVAIADIRRLVYDLRPPALDELGLVDTLRAQAERYGASGATDRECMVRVEADGLPATLPAAIEVAVYRIASEAMTNVIRHASARTCRIRLWMDDALYLDVIDDGRGLPDVVHSGIGIRSMRERAEELGGSLVVDRWPDGGTRVRARLPMTTIVNGSGG